jgi:hypothetical protein
MGTGRRVRFAFWSAPVLWSFARGPGYAKSAGGPAHSRTLARFVQACAYSAGLGLPHAPRCAALASCSRARR